MQSFLKMLKILLLSASLNSCKSIKYSDFQVSVTGPATGDCMQYNIISGKETRYKANSDICKKLKARSVWIDSENYRIFRGDILKNCQRAECEQFTGRFDSLFLAIDKALLKIPAN